VADAERAAGDRVDRGAVGGAVVGQQPLDGHAVAAVEEERAAQERDRRGRLLVREHLGVGEPGAVVDRDVHELPTDLQAPHALSVGASARVAAPARHPMSGAARDPAELLDVDVDQLARARALVALGRLEPQAPELAHPDPRQHPRDRRERHPEHLGDLGAREAQTPQRRDRLQTPLVGAVRDPPRSRRPIEQAQLALGPLTAHPLRGRALAHLGGRGRRAERPRLLDNAPAKLATLDQTESGVSVKLHPVSSLGLSGLGTSQPPGRPG
jgi:hypothetical protein